MSSRREYEIAFVGLKPGVHQFEYDIDDKFFEEFQQQDFRNCKAHVKLLLDKGTSTFIKLRFELGGSLQVTCDRCVNELPIQLFDEFTIVVKMVDDPELLNEQEEDPDVYYISKGDSFLDVKVWIYEFVNLSLPMQKTCEFENMDGPHCNEAARKVLRNLKVDEKVQLNAVWKGLQKFKDLEN